ncbi:MAG: hypothetical protein DMF69_03020 [Acidobacteria bacterium]|nr:MAG: hypothetical protein DMF69_03020 [Acidobacteriota bacterium]
MRVKFSLLSLLFLVIPAQVAFAKSSINTLVTLAASERNEEAAPAIAELRALGPAGLESLLRAYDSAIANHIANPTLASTPEWQRITTALDAVSQQRNSYLSGLYWYTDIQQAQKVSAETGKPILSLRLLGKLTDELSCANSRFFRTVLYSNSEISTLLRSRFVLHWQSVRPVPIITIDFGDGRKLERTVTGNSIHYILNSDGQPLDALPGVYGPQAFARSLANAETLFKSLQGKSEIVKRDFLNEYYRKLNNKISVGWLNDITKLGVKKPEGVMIEVGNDGEALSIMPLAVTKAITERTILRAMTAGSEALGRVTDESTWLKIAALHSADAVLDDRSIALIRKQNPELEPKVLSALIEKFQHSVALDTVRNEYRMHTQLLAWLSRDPTRTDIEKFNEKVYAELFITPRSDPWLGLLMPDTYTAIDNSGVVK